MTEWRPVPRTAGRFEVNMTGGVRSLFCRWGRRPEPFTISPSTDSSGYAFFQLWLDGSLSRSVRVHRAVYEAFCRPLLPSEQVDHINGDIKDNRLDNLRTCSRSENLRNQRRKRGSKSSRYKGVSWCKREGRYAAYIQIDGRRKFLGYYDCEHEASRSYNTAARMFFGEFSCLNLVEQEEGEGR